jgi:predicted molibdopterin-dependent oxidoreductase YjgC
MSAMADVLMAAVAPAAPAVTLTVDGVAVTVGIGSTVIAAIAQAQAGAAITRRSVTGMLRGPVCGMGVCQECRVSIDGRAHQLSCQTLCQPGMVVNTAAGEA